MMDGASSYVRPLGSASKGATTVAVHADWKRLRVVVLVLVLGLVTQVLAAQVPAGEQVETFSRIFAFDSTIAGSSPTVLLVSDEPDDTGLEELAAAFRAAGMTVRTTAPSRIAGEISGVSVVYFTRGSVTTEAREVVAEARALSIAAVPELAEAGRVSVALDPGDARMGIVVNAARLAVEGHTLSPQLLKQPWVTVSREATALTATGLPACDVTDFQIPSYPAVAQRVGLEGTVRLRVLVGDDLRPETVEVVDGVKFLDDAAVEAASASTYESEGWCGLAVPFELR